MTDHIITRRKLQAIKLKSDFLTLIEKVILSEEEKQILIMHYIDHKDFSYIGDTLGYAERSVIHKHRKILYKLKGVI